MAANVYKRTAHRWRLLSIMLIGVFFALGSFWLLQAMNNNDGVMQAGPHSTEPDYIVDNFSFVRMNETGQPRYVVSGARLTHRPVGDISEIEQPVVQSLAMDHPPMTMHAKRAQVRNTENQVDLIGNVDVQRPATPKAQSMRIRTEMLTVLPDEDLMKTDQPIEMQLGGATIRGTGMVANNATQQLHMASRGHIDYPPRGSR
jgi:lipopolysaccharide export system protein LptC